MDEQAVRRLADELRAVAAFGLNSARPDSRRGALAARFWPWLPA